jgi:very-short-patch-repair endonuclease
MAHDRRLPDWQVKPRVGANARALRRSLTDAERVIWYGLRAHRLDGIGFRRQTPIGPYIVDFVSHQAKLIIEIDGGQHFESEHLRRDARRDAVLESKGFRVLRFNNYDVLTNRTGVLESILSVIQDAPSPPSPASGGGGPTSANVSLAPASGAAKSTADPRS